MFWQGMRDLNPRMYESESYALPLGESPILNGERTGIRTPDTRLRRALLYPAELCTHISNKLVRMKGVEPPRQRR